MWDAVIGKIQEMLGYLARTIFEWVLDAVAALIEAIPVPEWYSNVDGVLSGGAGFAYWLDVFNVPEGLTIVMAAYVIRFVIRRIPLVG